MVVFTFKHFNSPKISIPANEGKYENISNFQLLINMQYIRNLLNNDNVTLPKISIQHNPVPDVKTHKIERSQLDAGLFLLIFSFLIIPSSLIICPLVEEKQNGIKVVYKHFDVNKLKYFYFFL